MVKSSNLGTKSLNVRGLLQRQVAKLASGLLFSWPLWRKNNTTINLQMFSSSYGAGVLPLVTRALTEGFIHSDLFL